MTETTPDIIGIDEVGYGAWAGPVFACAVLFHSPLAQDLMDSIKDSKKLSSKRRELLYHETISTVYYGLGYADAGEIDEFNIRQATNLAMKRAVDNLASKYAIKTLDYQILVDGNVNPGFAPNISTIIKGDDTIKQISCASIIAKVTRDNLMKKLHENYPHYGWDSNVGYGTKKHINGIKLFGISKYHRTSYKPFQKIMIKLPLHAQGI